MAATKEELKRRKRRLREAEVRREEAQHDAFHLMREAVASYYDGDVPFASGLLRKILLHNPEHPEALAMLGQIYFDAGHHADAVYYWNLLRKQPGQMTAEHLYLCGVANKIVGKHEEAQRSFTAFLEATARSKARQWAELRAAAKGTLEEMRLTALADKPRPPQGSVRVEAKPPLPAQEQVTIRKPPPQVELTLLPPAEMRIEGGGTLQDFWLCRRFLELKRAQSFEDLVCLPFLEGVDAYAYQQETVRRVLRQFQGRALLADEVGLGKTIEACLVLKEYWQRGMVRRALILTPASLVAQWRSELEGKFGLIARVPEGAAFRANPSQFWREEPLVVASLPAARRESQAAILSEVHWDMVIVDEAHALKNRTSANWRLVNSLQKRFLLLLSATPVENNLIELYNLITLLKPGLLETEADFKKRFMTAGKPKTPKDPERLRELLSEVMIRNTRAVVDVKLPPRIAATVTVDPTAPEQELYDRVSHYVSTRYRHNGHSAMTLSTLQREAGSSPRAIGSAVERIIAETGDCPELREIARLAAANRESSKGRQLGEMLLRETGKAVVFTGFMATLEELQDVCRARSIPYAVFRGDLSRAAKEAAIAHFRDEARVLLSTGAGGEGRNLQFARTVINFDLPWNPMRLEQRIGRVHRIGQTQDVYVFNFCQAGSAEEQLLRILHDKINMFELVIGEIDAILGRWEDDRDFAGVILDIWASSDGDHRLLAFDRLAEQLIAAKRQQIETEELDRELFAESLEA